ncbi:MAG: TIM barrel protein [Oscillospiraceae bacterium]|jgi:deoxyribonuclease-4
MPAAFGTAGNSDSYSKKYKSSMNAPEYLSDMGLDCYEYQCGKGVKTGRETAVKFGASAKELNISLSVHSPYFISLSSVEEEKRINSIGYIIQTANLAACLGAQRIVIHSGSASKISRSDALELAKDTLIRARKAAVDEGLSDIIFCPETMGKINQLGTLDEVMELCRCDDSFLPCIDFGHLNARTAGSIKTKRDFEKILDTIENTLGADRLKIFHSHFSKIEFTKKGGEVRHLTFEDTAFGPDFEPLMELVAKKNLSPVFICESAGTQDIDALTMKKYYLSL